MSKGPWGVLAVMALALASCTATAGSGSSSAEVTVYAAASLKRVLDDVRTAYEASTPGVTLVVSTDSSAALRTQIEQGAPVDVFLAADTKQPQALVDAGLSTGPATPFAGNRLTIIVPTSNRAGILSPADLARPGVRIIAAGDEVPITSYATESVGKLGALNGYPDAFAASYAANIVSREDNVKAVVAKIELGEGDAGIVYLTDAAASTGVVAVAIPDAANVVATYAGLVVKASDRIDRAQDFLDWLTGTDGQGILTRHGFTPPPR